MIKKKIYVVGYAKFYANFIIKKELVNNMEEADIVLFTGGEDVSPSLYDEKKNIYTSANEYRDIEETDEFIKAISFDKNMIGICRGAQFLTVMSGGKLIQHVENHAIGFGHPIIFKKDNSISVITSTHHQMMYPFEMDKNDYDIIASSSENRSEIYLGAPGIVYSVSEEPEIVFYPKTKSLAIQGHPEQMDIKDHAVVMINRLIDKYFNYDN